jgi:hypothetical protein
MAIIWIRVGMDDTDENAWVNTFIGELKDSLGDDSIKPYDYFGTIYVSAFYFILTTITTVGYGDISGGTTNEYLYSMIVEFVGLTFFSFLTGTISVMFTGNQSFESLMNARLEELDLWLLRLENCNADENIPPSLF